MNQEAQFDDFLKFRTTMRWDDSNTMGELSNMMKPDASSLRLNFILNLDFSVLN